ncbi:MAG: tetratricopeptide repeat protein [Burkholderiales bacterium]
MNKTIPHALIIVLLAATSAFAMDDRPKPDPKDPDKKSAQPLDQARAAIDRKDWVRAQDLTRQALERDPRSADAHNLYAFSIRKGANPNMDLVFMHYNEALRLNPKHLGAHEYLAEAYLMTGNLAKAKELHAQLGALCNAKCEEYAALGKEITSFERQHASK